MQNTFQSNANNNQIKGWIDSFWLKLIAIFAMTCDHIAYSFGSQISESNFSLYWIMRFFGRLTFPIMAFLLVQGFNHTHNLKKYASRLFGFAIISIVPYYLLFHSNEKLTVENFFLNNVLFTLLIGLIMLFLIKNVKKFYLEFLIVFAAMLASSFSDWGSIGPLLIYVFYKIKNPWSATAINFLIFIIYDSLGFFDSFTKLTNNGVTGSQAFSSLLPWHTINLGFILAILVIGLYNGKRGLNNKFVKWGYYWYYPVHLMVLYLIKLLII